MKKIMIMLMALLLVGSVSAISDSGEFTARDFDDLDIIGTKPIQWFPFMEPRFFIYVGVEQTCNEIPDILDHVNAIINNIYWQQYWLNYQPEDDYVGGGSSPIPVQDDVEEELEFNPDLNTDGQVGQEDLDILSEGYGTDYDVFDLSKLGNAWTGDSDNYGRTDCSEENQWCNLDDLNQDGAVDVFDLAIIGNQA